VSGLRIRRAIIPAAGRGTRLLPLTRAVPKEMLPLGRKPVLEYIVEEAISCGISEILFIVSGDKRCIYDHFRDFSGALFSFVVQPEQKGLGDAVRCGEEFAAGEPFAVLLGDSVISSRETVTPLGRALASYEQGGASGIIVVEDCPVEHAHRYGMVKPSSSIGLDRKKLLSQRFLFTEPFEISDLIEKPEKEDVPSRYAIAGRYAFDAQIFDYIRQTKPGAGGEIQLTDAIKLMLADGHPVRCVPLLQGETRRDIGTFSSYFEAFVARILEDPEAEEVVSALLEQHK